MKRKNVVSIALALTVAVTAAQATASSSFQFTCSNIGFVYLNNQPAVQAVCLRVDGTANPTSLVIQGIANSNGNLVRAQGPSSFHRSCGNIQIAVDGQNVVLTALCRTVQGAFTQTAIALDGIGNLNGVLSY